MHLTRLQSGPLCVKPYWRKKLAFQVNPLSCLNPLAWESELEDDQDKDFLLNGIRNGFSIIDEAVEVTPVQCGNHPSAKPGSPLYAKASAQVRREIEAGNYVICDDQPDIISPMAAIPKPDGDVRIILDCSTPAGKAVNNNCSCDWHQKFSRVDDAAS